MTRIAIVLALLLWTALAHAEDAAPPPSAEEAPKDPAVSDYCVNFADRATDARIAWQTENLKALQAEVTKKIDELDEKQKAIQGWIDKRDAILKQAGKELVDIYAKMDPEAAAQQLAKLDTGTAVAVLRQLTPRTAGTIMASIPPDRAAVFARAIAATTLELAPPPAATPKERGS